MVLFSFWTNYITEWSKMLMNYGLFYIIHLLK